MTFFGSDLTFWIAFSAGFLSFFSPCVLPLIPSYITYITGLSFGQLQEAHPARKVRLTVLIHSVTFVLGFSAVFIGMGALAGVASSTFQTVMKDGLVWLQRAGGLLIFLFGIHMSGVFHFGVLMGDKRVQIQNKPGGLAGTFLIGIAFAAGWTPCIGPILGAILAMAAGTSGSTAKSMLLLGCYAAGLGIPFIVSGLLFHSFLDFFKRFKSHIRKMEFFTGFLLMGVGILLFFGLFNDLTTFLYRLLPAGD
ncbi:Cytochrome c-type biogenesis protein CcdA [Citrifermentans bremense]|uniref:Cytochrome c-type biogenesis protein CcdA n=1 Tax=Citrifermentans bremense TaxID=60035 RepID=A0A6S6LZE0_9BACT|nr:cytochrome c biogenesis protein CcdA [Citrifermentans bremense]BCG46689.1 Cytochrome c-type biogenesis protein CcdA [Citrifermentans bremense]